MNDKKILSKNTESVTPLHTSRVIPN